MNNRFVRAFFIVFLVIFFSKTLLASAVTNNGNDDNRIKIFADTANYNKKDKTALISGHVKIIQDNVTIFTWTALYNEAKKITNIDNFVRIIHLDKETNRKTDISSNKMIVYHADKKVHLENDVRFDREESRRVKVENKKASNKDKIEESIRRERTVINSDFADYWTNSGDAVFLGKALLLQKEKKAQADQISIKNDKNKNTDKIILEKNADVIQIKGDWLQKEGIVDPKDDEEKERLIKEKIEVNADKITIYSKTNDMLCENNVKIKQNVGTKFREATGDKSFYKEKDKTVTLTGNVKIKKENGDWLNSEKAIFHTDSENFQAFGTENDSKKKGNKQVESEFYIEDDKASPTPKPIVTPEKEFNLDEKSSIKTMPTAPNSSKGKVIRPKIQGLKTIQRPKTLGNSSKDAPTSSSAVPIKPPKPKI